MALLFSHSARNARWRTMGRRPLGFTSLSVAASGRRPCPGTALGHTRVAFKRKMSRDNQSEASRSRRESEAMKELWQKQVCAEVFTGVQGDGASAP